jgi:hypothetical protein
LSIRGTRYDQYSQIEELRLKQGPSFLIPTTIKECKQALRNAQAKVSLIAQNRSQHRKDENISKVAALELEGNKDRAKILRNIRKAEEEKFIHQQDLTLQSSTRHTFYGSTPF